MPEQTPPAKSVPSITGNPMYDTTIAGAISGVGGLITGITVGWLNAHGFQDPNLYTYVFTGVTGTLGSIAVVIWRVLVSKRNQIAHADEVINAVATGHISEQIKKIAVAAPSISDDKIMAAVTNAEKIKQRNG